MDKTDGKVFAVCLGLWLAWKSLDEPRRLQALCVLTCLSAIEVRFRSLKYTYNVAVRMADSAPHCYSIGPHGFHCGLVD